jgi:hypothetical protein
MDKHLLYSQENAKELHFYAHITIPCNYCDWYIAEYDPENKLAF